MKCPGAFADARGRSPSAADEVRRRAGSIQDNKGD